MKKKVGIYTWHNISSAYACLIYLKDKLEQSAEVILWSFTDLADIQSKKKGFRSFSQKWYGKIPRLRVYMAKLDFLIDAVNKDIVIINDLDFFIPAYLLKKLYPSKIIIHYNTEIVGNEVPCFEYIMRFYRKHADFPDVIIECLKERALWRKKEFGILKDIEVINNTLPLKRVENINIDEEIFEILNKFELKNPIVIYAGKASLSRQLNEIIDCIDGFKNKANFLFFCYGSEEEKKILQQYVSCKCHYNNYIIHDSVERNMLFKIMEGCDIGVNYYKSDFSVNHYFASPSKFFEYMACGLNILSTDNEGINHIIEENRIGVCIKEGESIGSALERLLALGLANRKDIKQLFKDKYSYEIDSVKAINRILNCDK